MMGQLQNGVVVPQSLIIIRKKSTDKDLKDMFMCIIYQRMLH